MSVKEQSPFLWEPYLFYKEIPEEFLNETEVDKCFYPNISHISESQHRIARFGKRSKGNIL